MKQQLVIVEELTKSQLLVFSQRNLSHLDSKKEGQKVTCPCCNKTMVTGSAQWIRHMAALKAWVTMRGGIVSRSNAAKKANQTRQEKPKSVKSTVSKKIESKVTKKVSLIKKIKVTKQTKIDAAVQKTEELKRTDLLLEVN